MKRNRPKEKAGTRPVFVRHGEGLLAMRVVGMLRSLIDAGMLKPGDRIPPEREIATTLGISRATVRTGICRLAAAGLVEVRHGHGTFVASAGFRSPSKSWNMIGTLYGFELRNLCEARILLEGCIAALAAQRSRDGDYLALADEVATIFANDGDSGDRQSQETEFRRVIARASNNPFIAALASIIAGMMEETLNHAGIRDSERHSSAARYLEIYRALRARDAILARQLVERDLRERFSAVVACDMQA
jgi:GntR family transcriptional repressor for pyruvate dehydrogenase complex